MTEEERIQYLDEFSNFIEARLIELEKDLVRNIELDNQLRASAISDRIQMNKKFLVKIDKEHSDLVN